MSGSGIKFTLLNTKGSLRRLVTRSLETPPPSPFLRRRVTRRVCVKHAQQGDKGQLAHREEDVDCKVWYLGLAVEAIKLSSLYRSVKRTAGDPPSMELPGGAVQC